MAFMQSRIASSAGVADMAASSMVARICIAAHADVIGANVNERAIRIARIGRRQSSGRVLSRVKLS